MKHVITKKIFGKLLLMLPSTFLTRGSQSIEQPLESNAPKGYVAHQADKSSPEQDISVG